LPQFRSQGLSTSSGREALPKVNKENEMIGFRMVIFAPGSAGLAAGLAGASLTAASLKQSYEISATAGVIRHGA
jgi:hypothetical protein